MRRISICLCLFGAVLAAQNAVQRIQDVKTIYVDSFGKGEDAGLIKSKVIERLGQSKTFEVVQSADKADAILAGSGAISDHDPHVNGVNIYRAAAVVELKNKDQKVLWKENATNRPFTDSVSSSLAAKIVKDLISAKGAKAP